MKRRRHEDPLKLSVERVLSSLIGWKDANGIGFTLEEEIVTGTDHVILRVKHVDEVNAADALRVMQEIPEIVSCVCNFNNRAIEFRFESNVKRLRAITEDEETRKHHERTELDKLSRNMPNESSAELTLLAQYVVAVKNPLPQLRQEKININIQSSHGVLTLTVRKLQSVDAEMMHSLSEVTKAANADASVVIFLSPQDCQCLRIRVKKHKRTVNV
jgi:hypothetical protein